MAQDCIESRVEELIQAGVKAAQPIDDTQLDAMEDRKNAVRDVLLVYILPLPPKVFFPVLRGGRPVLGYNTGNLVQIDDDGTWKFEWHYKNEETLLRLPAEISLACCLVCDKIHPMEEVE